MTIEEIHAYVKSLEFWAWAAVTGAQRKEFYDYNELSKLQGKCFLCSLWIIDINNVTLVSECNIKCPLRHEKGNRGFNESFNNL
jgi:hypothetical protein